MLRVGREKHGGLFAERLVERIEPLAIRYAPELHGRVRARGCEHLAIGRKRDVENRAFMDVDCADEFRGRAIPQPDDAVVSRGGHDGPIGRKLGIIKRIARTAILADQRAIFDAPELRRAAQSDDARGYKKPRTIGRKMHRIHFAGKSVESLEHGVVRGIANLDCATLCNGEHLAIRGVRSGGNRLRTFRRARDFRHAERLEKRHIIGGSGCARGDPFFKCRHFRRR